jgi:hypothetical protein
VALVKRTEWPASTTARPRAIARCVLPGRRTLSGRIQIGRLGEAPANNGAKTARVIWTGRQVLRHHRLCPEEVRNGRRFCG